VEVFAEECAGIPSTGNTKVSGFALTTQSHTRTCKPTNTHDAHPHKQTNKQTNKKTHACACAAHILHMRVVLHIKVQAQTTAFDMVTSRRGILSVTGTWAGIAYSNLVVYLLPIFLSG